MSTAAYLEASIDSMVELGVVTRKFADNTDHTVDDAVYALDTLTDYILCKPAILEAFKEQSRLDIIAANREKSAEYLWKTRKLVHLVDGEWVICKWEEQRDMMKEHYRELVDITGFVYEGD